MTTLFKNGRQVKKQNSKKANDHPVKKPDDDKPKKKSSDQKPIEQKPADQKPIEQKQVKKRDGDFTRRIEYAAELMLMQQYTDDEIAKMVAEKFPTYPIAYDKKEIARTRWMLRHDKLPNVHADGRRFDRMFLIDGNLVPKADKPKSKQVRAREKVMRDKDLLKIIADVDVHDASTPSSPATE